MNYGEMSEALKRAGSYLSNLFSSEIGVEPNSRFKIYRFLYEETDLTRLFYWISLLSSAGIATLGLAQNSPAVVIGAMLLSPLMGPIIALGLSLAIGDLYLGFRAAVGCILSIIAVLCFSALITYILPFQLETSEILARTRPNTLDLGVALFCGIIGAISVARMPIGGVSMALPGVAIAVALVPPLCAAGFGLGADFKWNIFFGAFLLFLTNFVSIVFSSLVIFLMLKMGDDKEIDRIRDFISEKARKNPLFSRLTTVDSMRSFRKVGKLSNRIIVLGLALIALLVPLNIILNQIKREVIIKRETQRAIFQYLPGSNILSKEIDITKKETNIHFVLLSGMKSQEDKIRQIQNYLRIKLNESVNVSYSEVANLAALAAVKESASPVFQDLNQVSKEIDSKYFRKIRELLPENREGELLRIGLAKESGSASPIIEMVFLSDDNFTPGEKGILMAAIKKIVSDKASLRVRTVPITVTEIDIANKGENQDISAVAGKISLLRNGIENIVVVPEILVPERISDLKRAKAFWRTEEIMKELHEADETIMPVEPVKSIEAGRRTPALRIRLERR